MTAEQAVELSPDQTFFNEGRDLYNRLRAAGNLSLSVVRSETLAGRETLRSILDGQADEMATMFSAVEEAFEDSELQGQSDERVRQIEQTWRGILSGAKTSGDRWRGFFMQDWINTWFGASLEDYEKRAT